MPRKPHKYHFIYKTICTINENFYYGMHSTSNLNDGYIGSGTRLWHSINKYGRENFKIEILEFLPDRESLKIREKELITDEMLKNPMCMNLKPGGNGGICNEDHLIKLHKGASLFNTNRNLNDLEFRIKMKEVHSNIMKKRWSEGLVKSFDWTGKKLSESHKNAIKNALQGKQKGELNSQFGTMWIKNEFENKKIKKDELDHYIKQGWSIGRKLNKVN